MTRSGNNEESQNAQPSAGDVSSMGEAESSRAASAPSAVDTPSTGEVPSAVDASLVGGQDQPRAASVRQPLPPQFWIMTAVAVLALAVAGVLAFQMGNQSVQGRDPNAALGQLEGKTPEELQAELDRIVEEGMFNISIASYVEFADGAAEGEMRIENVPGNHYLMQVEVVRDDTGETVYRTGMIEPNHHIQRARLDVDLDAGSYACTAVFYAFEPDTEEPVGQAAAQMTIVVAG